MKILHTSDWHLGHRLHEQSQVEEQKLFLSWLLKTIDKQQVELLLIAGDVFDTGSPSAQSLEMYYSFLIDLRSTSCKHVIVTGGNHDAPGTLNAPREVLKALSIHVVGKATENIAEEVFLIEGLKDKVVVAAVPYLRDQDIRRAVAGESFAEVADRYKHALVSHYQQVAEYCASQYKDDVPVIAMGHLFAVGGSTSDSEQTIYVGGQGDIGADDFPELFDYVALGHLHRPQKIGKKLYYSGSPYILSFSEIGYAKKVYILDTQASVSEPEAIEIPVFRFVHKVKGTLRQVISQLQLIHQQEHTLIPWIEVTLQQEGDELLRFSDLTKAVEGLNLLVLKVAVDSKMSSRGGFEEQYAGAEVSDLQPIEVFEMKCKEEGFDLKQHPDIKDAFYEIWQLAKDQDA